MRPLTVKYSKCFNVGNNENEVISVELQVEENEKVEEVMFSARKIVNESSQEALNNKFQHYQNIILHNNQISESEEIELYRQKDVKEAHEWLKKHGQAVDDLPF